MTEGTGAGRPAPRPVSGPDPQGPAERVEYAVFRVDDHELRNVTAAARTPADAWAAAGAIMRRTPGKQYTVLRREVTITEWEQAQ